MSCVVAAAVAASPPSASAAAARSPCRLKCNSADQPAGRKQAGHPRHAAQTTRDPQAADPRRADHPRPAGHPQATRKGLTRGGFLEKFVVKSLERPTERVALGTLLHRIPRPIRPKTSPCKPLAGCLGWPLSKSDNFFDAPQCLCCHRAHLVRAPLEDGFEPGHVVDQFVVSLLD